MDLNKEDMITRDYQAVWNAPMSTDRYAASIADIGAWNWLVKTVRARLVAKLGTKYARDIDDGITHTAIAILGLDKTLGNPLRYFEAAVGFRAIRTFEQNRKKLFGTVAETIYGELKAGEEISTYRADRESSPGVRYDAKELCATIDKLLAAWQSPDLPHSQRLDPTDVTIFVMSAFGVPNADIAVLLESSLLHDDETAGSVSEKTLIHRIDYRKSKLRNRVAAALKGYGFKVYPERVVQPESSTPLAALPQAKGGIE